MSTWRRIAVWVGLMSPGVALAGGHVPRGLSEATGSVRVLGHRGASGEAPENTLAAFARAAELGVGFELDVTLCATGEVVVLHDDTVDRTTDGSGAARALSLEALRELDAGAWFGAEHLGQRVPTLDEVLTAFAGRVPINIELKTTDERDALAAAVVRSVLAAGAVDSVFVTSFDPYLLEAVAARAPELRRGQITATFRDADLSPVQKLALRGMWLNGRSQPDLISMEHVRLTRRRVRRLKRRGYTVLAWTVNDLAEVDRLLALGVDGVMTDDPAVVLAHLGGAAGG